MNKPYEYGIPDGIYKGRPTTASCYEKDGKLILDIRFAVIDPKSGKYYMKDNGYEWEATKRHWLTTKDGGFNEMTINGIKEWAKGWNPQTFDDFYWFQKANAEGTPFGNLAAVGEVELNFTRDKGGNQTIFVHDPNRQRSALKAFVPDGGTADQAALAAKWGAKAKALFASTPKKVAAVQSPSRPTPAPAPAPSRSVEIEGWDKFEHSCDGAFDFFCSRLGEPYSGVKHDEKWFAIIDKVSNGKDPDQFTQDDIKNLFKAVVG